MKTLLYMMRNLGQGSSSSSSSRDEQELSGQHPNVAASSQLQAGANILRDIAYGKTPAPSSSSFDKIMELYVAKSLTDENLSLTGYQTYTQAQRMGISNMTSFPALEEKDRLAIADFESQALLDEKQYLLQKAQSLKVGKTGVLATIKSVGHSEVHQAKMNYIDAAIKYLSNPSKENLQAYNEKSGAFQDPPGESDVKTLRQEINKFDEKVNQVSEVGHDKYMGAAMADITPVADDDLDEITAASVEGTNNNNNNRNSSGF